MATKEQLKGHIDKAKSAKEEAKKKAGDNKYDSNLRQSKKKFKRLTRKVAKIDYREKMLAEKGKKKKEG
ncbi:MULTISPECIES: hypothetical protein [unclassified Nitrospina]|uniref:hypothetical protein n=1 Tax=unclassified Nitrospina TaxID=2638683 RepID=UPI003F94440D